MTPKAKLKSKALKLWYNKYLKNKCEVCGSTFVLQGHHFFYRSSYGHLMFDPQNHITLCRKCHFALHHQDPKKIEQIIIAKRGKKWYNRLLKKSRIKPKSSYQNFAYYNEQIKKLS